MLNHHSCYSYIVMCFQFFFSIRLTAYDKRNTVLCHVLTSPVKSKLQHVAHSQLCVLVFVELRSQCRGLKALPTLGQTNADKPECVNDGSLEQLVLALISGFVFCRCPNYRGRNFTHFHYATKQINTLLCKVENYYGDVKRPVMKMNVEQ